MDPDEKIFKLIGQPEGEQIEYKAVLPPAKSVGQLIAAFANTKGGTIVLGVTDRNNKIETIGLSEDFRANSIVHKAIDLLSPKPLIQYFYSTHKGKRIYVIEVQKSSEEISIEGKIFKRDGVSIVAKNLPNEVIQSSALPNIISLNQKLKTSQCTEALSKFLEHYQSVLKIISDLDSVLYPVSSSTPTNKAEGKILIRILFSSCADNFETYLSDLLYEIYLAKPESLKSEESVTIKEVLDCSDIQEFINYFAKKKLSKLKRGSVKAFLSENTQIDSLKVIDKIEEKKIEKLLQIRHLYAHNNGRSDEKFIKYFPEYKVNELHEMSIDTIIEYLDYLSSIAAQIDKAAMLKFNLNNNPSSIM
ncbi:transcriptional regulator [Flavobacterium sp. Leaf359]|uniref:AlbA family DNA-binding domain-containing protein n=1 Tax=Flavobacterium sp. Leaf359 TaxID=1736351 RepID=UPI0006FF6EA1|nr:ATP-binding protein [Flavobacterium sp. Leaf359]KQS45894.1 transcriptional regulator [Flavobacterium sp. Leaf359]